MSNRKTLEEKIEMQKVKAEQEANNLKKLLQEQKAAERKARNHRLCKRGGIVEKLLPGLPGLSDEQFDTFVQKVLLTPHTTKIMSELAPPVPDDAGNAISKPHGNGDAATKPTESEKQANPSSAVKPEGTPQADGVNSNGNKAAPERAAV
jgi:hypothetical protein